MSTIVVSALITFNEKSMLEKLFKTSGVSFASYIAKLSRDPLISKNTIQLDAIVHDATRDDNITYALVYDAQGELLTSQYASIDYQSPINRALLSTIPSDLELKDVISIIKKHQNLIEISVPINLDVKNIGKVTIGMSTSSINNRVLTTIISVIAINLGFVFVLGFVLFFLSQKILLDPLAQLTLAVADLASGDFSTHINIKADAEIQVLIDSFNLMATDLKTNTISKNYFDNIIRGLMDPLLVFSPEGKILMANPATSKLLAYEEEELINNSINLIFEDHKLLARILSEGNLNNIETIYINKNGDRVPVLFSASAVVGEGQNNNFVCAAKDTSNIKRLEQQLLLSSKLASVGTLAAGVAHEINNPLAIIQGYSTLLKEMLESDDAAKNSDRINLINKQEIAVNRVADIVNGLRLYARADTEIVETIDIEKAIKNILNFTEKIFTKDNVTIETVFKCQNANIKGNYGKIQQVIMNLVGNARDAIKEIRPQGKIQIATSSQDKNIEILISDDGNGIDAEKINKIFDPFYTTKPPGKGTGLGLSISLNIIQLFKGKLEVKSEKGIGTTFKITFPIEEITEKAILAEEQVAERKKKYKFSGKVLVVDDEEDIREIVLAYLDDFGMETCAASDGAEALKLLQNNQVDVIITDLQMPNMTGERLLMEAQNIPHLKDTRYIVMTGGIATDYSKEQRGNLRNLAHAYIKKPFSKDSIAQALSEVLGQNQAA
ncbi:MAG: ATP-binding protein [Pseudomonadota bacterium]